MMLLDSSISEIAAKYRSGEISLDVINECFKTSKSTIQP